MICPACHHEIDEGAEVCFDCGHRFVTPTSVTRGSVIANRYEIQSQLGRGGMGIVFKARDRVLDEDVAIKVLRPEVAQEPELSKRFRSEIKLARKVSHKNVCRIHEYGEDAGLRYISMEFIDGGDLRKLIRQAPIQPETAFDLALQIAAGVEAIHEAGVLHRDLKTPNVMVNAHGVVKLMDFGIAKRTAADATAGATGTGQVVGTPEYMSPEQARGGQIDVRSDVYALGIMIFEIFTGDVPFRGDTPLSTLLKHLNEPPPLTGPQAARLPPALAPVLERALAKDPERRYPHAGEVARALRGAQRASGIRPAASAADEVEVTASVKMATPSVAARRPAPVAPISPPDGAGEGRSRRRRALWPLAAAAALGATALVVGLWLRPAPVPPPDPSAISIASSTPPQPSIAATLPTAPPSAAVAKPESPAPVSPRPRPAVPRAAPSADPRASGGGPQKTARATEPTPSPAPLPTPTPAPTPPPAPTPTPTPVPTPQPPAGGAPLEEKGFLQVTVVPGAELLVDGQSLGQVTSKKVALAPGAHFVRFVHADYLPVQRKITILPGETAKLILDLAEEAISKKR
jgi:eukaryotic-like serine/threonine-protein kinase